MVEGPEDYVPPERTALAQRMADEEEEGEEAAMDVDDDEEEEDDELTYHQEMALEMKGERLWKIKKERKK